MTPEQEKSIKKLFRELDALHGWGWSPAAVDATRAEFDAWRKQCEQLEQRISYELSHYVRVTEPTPVSERRCGGCVKYSVCMHARLGGGEDYAATCKAYSDGALPEGIAAVVRAAYELRRLRKLHDAPVRRWPSGKSLESADRAFESCVDALSAAELAMAGVKDDHG